MLRALEVGDLQDAAEGVVLGARLGVVGVLDAGG